LAERRNNLLITAEILQLAREGARKTRIVYGANLNFKLLNRYLDQLERIGLVTSHAGEGSLIRTTEKGMRFLDCYSGLQQLVDTPSGDGSSEIA